MNGNFKFPLIFSIFLVSTWFSPSFCAVSSLQKYISKYHPRTITEGSDHIIRKYPKHKIEVTQSFGVTEETVLFIEAVVEEHFSGRFDTDSINAIQEAIQSNLGGYWAVQFYEDPYMFATTSFRRSPSFLVLDVDGCGVAAIKGA